jgi:hypothetical protein
MVRTIGIEVKGWVWQDEWGQTVSVFGILEERAVGSRAECGTVGIFRDGLWKLIVWLLIVLSQTFK